MIKNMVFPTPEAWKSLWILKTYQVIIPPSLVVLAARCLNWQPLELDTCSNIRVVYTKIMWFALLVLNACLVDEFTSRLAFKIMKFRFLSRLWSGEIASVVIKCGISVSLSHKERAAISHLCKLQVMWALWKCICLSTKRLPFFKVKIFTKTENHLKFCKFLIYVGYRSCGLWKCICLSIKRLSFFKVKIFTEAENHLKFWT